MNTHELRFNYKSAERPTQVLHSGTYDECKNHLVSIQRLKGWSNPENIAATISNGNYDIIDLAKERALKLNRFGEEMYPHLVMLTSFIMKNVPKENHPVGLIESNDLVDRMKLKLEETI